MSDGLNHIALAVEDASDAIGAITYIIVLERFVSEVRNFSNPRTAFRWVASRLRHYGYTVDNSERHIYQELLHRSHDMTFSCGLMEFYSTLPMP